MQIKYLWFCWWSFTGFTFRCGNTSWFCHSRGNTSCFGRSCLLWVSWWDGLFLRRDLNFLFTPFPLLVLFILSFFHLSQFGASLHRTCFRRWVLFRFGVWGNCLRAALGRGERVYPSLGNKKNCVTNQKIRGFIGHTTWFLWTFDYGHKRFSNINKQQTC